MPPRRAPCTRCGSTKFRRRDGVLYCREGHQVQGYVQVEGDEADAAREIVYGPEGQMLAYEAFQIILQHQVAAMRDRLGLPAEFEALCRDIWLLIAESHELKAPAPAAAPPGSGGPEVEDLDAPIASSVRSSQALYARVFGSQSGFGLGSDDDDDESESGSESGSGSDTGKLKYAKREDPAELLANAPKRKVPRLQSADTISLSLAPCILYVACLHLRVPLLVGDVHRMCAANEIPYLSAYTLLPPVMQKTVMGRFHHALQPWYVPQPVRMHHLVTSVVQLLDHTFGIATPPVAAPGLLVRWAIEWRQPASFYSRALRLITAYTSASGRDLTWLAADPMTRDPRGATPRGSPHNPELLLGALVLLAVRSQLPVSEDDDANADPHALPPLPPISAANPPTTYPALMAWASQAPAEFAAFTAKNVPGFAPSDAWGGGKWANVESLLEGIVGESAPPAQQQQKGSGVRTGLLSLQHHGSDDDEGMVEQQGRSLAHAGAYLAHARDLVLTSLRCTGDDFDQALRTAAEVLARAEAA
ncbi:hypothetical protein H9P43_003603 [Blastocladiella emersonii ATCC 22665]|nr:hypothetical protein H9P43_003603 [Blastocladiella emersonii ATCC 22665]